MSARSCGLECAALSGLMFVLASCRGGESIIVPVADGAIVAPFASPEAYVPRLEALGARRLLVPWVDGTTDVEALRTVVSERPVALILGLVPALPPGPRPRREALELAVDRALERVLIAESALEGIHLDHLDAPIPTEDDATALDVMLARVRARTTATLSVGIPMRSRDSAVLTGALGTTGSSSIAAENDGVAWATAWARILRPRVDRVVVHVDDATHPDLSQISDDIGLLAERLDGVELWAAVDMRSPTRPPERLTRTPRIRERSAIARAVRVLRTHARAVLVEGAEAVEPDALLSEASPSRAAPVAAFDPELDARASAVDQRLRRVFLREGQIMAVRDARFDRDRGPNAAPHSTVFTTGIYTAALAFRYGATGDAVARDEAREAFGALRQLARTVEPRGRVVSTFTRALDPTAQSPSGAGGPRWHRLEDRELYFGEDATMHEITGWLLGAAIYHDLVASEAERIDIRTDVAAVVDARVKAPLRLFEPGDATSATDLAREPILALAFLQVAAHVTGEPRFAAEINRLLEKEDAVARAVRAIARVYDGNDRDADGALSTALFALIAFESDIARRIALESAVELHHARVQPLGDAYAEVTYGFSYPTSVAARRGARTLANFRTERLDNEVFAAETPELNSGPFVPLEDRPPRERDFAPEPDGPARPSGGLRTGYSGVTFLLSHWVSRYSGAPSISE